MRSEAAPTWNHIYSFKTGTMYCWKLVYERKDSGVTSAKDVLGSASSHVSPQMLLLALGCRNPSFIRHHVATSFQFREGELTWNGILQITDIKNVQILEKTHLCILSPQGSFTEHQASVQGYLRHVPCFLLCGCAASFLDIFPPDSPLFVHMCCYVLVTLILIFPRRFPSSGWLSSIVFSLPPARSPLCCSRCGIFLSSSAESPVSFKMCRLIFSPSRCSFSRRICSLIWISFARPCEASCFEIFCILKSQRSLIAPCVLVLRPFLRQTGFTGNGKSAVPAAPSDAAPRRVWEKVLSCLLSAILCASFKFVTSFDARAWDQICFWCSQNLVPSTFLLFWKCRTMV